MLVIHVKDGVTVGDFQNRLESIIAIPIPVSPNPTRFPKQIRKFTVMFNFCVVFSTKFLEQIRKNRIANFVIK